MLWQYGVSAYNVTFEPGCCNNWHIHHADKGGDQILIIPILAGGRMNDPDIAEAAIRESRIDAVVLGRAALADPEYPNKILSGHTEKIRSCIACNQGCITRLQQGNQPTCAVNPTAIREIRYALKLCIQPKKVIVVGGGAAGMGAARTATMRGHRVT